MNPVAGTFDTEAAKALTLEKLSQLFARVGASSLYVKKLAPNDNSKNQPYFGGQLTELSFLPTGEPVASNTTSNKNSDLKRRIKYQVPMDLTWIDADGEVYAAPHAKLIFYPQYPEVRFSGFLKGSKVEASDWMDPYKRGRSLDRWLVFGVSPSNTIYAYLVTPDCALSDELNESNLLDIGSVFRKVDTNNTGVTNARSALLAKLLEIHLMGWISGQQRKNDGSIVPSAASNAGGYTLESMLGIIPNGSAEPDYLGWEVKQFGVSGFPQKGARPTTLLTPEPDGGYYQEYGSASFVRKFGYPDKSGKPDRLNFGGRHFAGAICKTTNLTMTIDGFDLENNKITDAAGIVSLRSEGGLNAASWSFPKLMGHWKKKHSLAVYVPCILRKSSVGNREYYYGNTVELGIGTDFELFLSAMVDKSTYYDPGIKLEYASTDKAKLKPRSQFRINHKNIPKLYKNYEYVDLII
jgi:hypothetical protein